MSYIAIRSAEVNDRATVLAFCTHTWDWGDYIDQAWDQWVQNPAGKLLVATTDATPVGVVHLQMLSKDDAWIEGLRVDPAYRRQGIARALNEAALVEVMQQKATYVRMAIHFENEASIQLAESMYLRQVGAFSIYTASPVSSQGKPSRQQRTQIATMDDLDDIINYLNVSSIFPLVGGLYYAHFQGLPITAELLEQKINAGQIYLLRRWERIDGLAIAEPLDEYGEHRLSVGYIDGTTIEAISLIAYDLHHRLLEMELDAIRVYAPDMVLIRDAFDGVEYHTDGDIFFSYERGLV